MGILPGSLSREMSHPSHKGSLHLSFVRGKCLRTFMEELHRKDTVDVGEGRRGGDEKEKENVTG